MRNSSQDRWTRADGGGRVRAYKEDGQEGKIMDASADIARKAQLIKEYLESGRSFPKGL